MRSKKVHIDFQKTIQFFLFGLIILCFHTLSAQFYNGSDIEFGKNRVQYEDFDWQYYRFERYETYFYTGGEDLAKYTATYVNSRLRELETLLDYYLDEKIQFIVYNKHSDFKQSNIGLGIDESYSIGGVTRIVGSKVFIYFEGDYKKFNEQIDAGIIEVLIYQMMYGGSWKDVLKNSALLSLPSWYINGLIAYLVDPQNEMYINEIKDGIAQNKYYKFNRLKQEEAKIASYAMWTYIAENFGNSTISNILYMTRSTRDVEDGILYVTGLSFDKLTNDWIDYFSQTYINNSSISYAENVELLDLKVRKNRVYQQLAISPNNEKIAYVTNQRGQYKLFIFDKNTNKRKRIFKDEHKLDRIIDYSYPIIDWHPSSKLLSFFIEEKGQILLCTYELESNQLYKKPIFGLEKVLNFDYSPDGKQMVLSAVFEGQTDLYIYNIGGNTQKKITDDIYDDIQAVFIREGIIAFASNRPNDSIEFQSIAEIKNRQQEKDIFVYDYNSLNPKLIKVTNTNEQSEKYPIAYQKDIAYLGLDNNLVYNRIIAEYDSSISSIDTIINYNYYYTKKQGSNFNRNILVQKSSAEGDYFSEILKENDRYLLSSKSSDNPYPPFNKESATSKKTKQNKSKKSTIAPIEEIKHPQIILKSKESTVKTTKEVDISNYQFDKERPKQEVKRRVISTVEEVEKTTIPEVEVPFELGNQRNYNLNFKIDNSALQLNNSFLTGQYQVFTGRPYQNPGLGAIVKLGVVDLFEDYRVWGGFRYSGPTKEYLLGFQDLKNRLDKEYIFSRSKTSNESSVLFSDIFTLKGSFSVIYPFSEVTSLRGTISLRNDKIVPLAVSTQSLEIPIDNQSWASLKTAYVFDNTRNIALNIKYGSRFKLFGEYYQKAYDSKENAEDANLFVLGMDFRNYQKISRGLIFVSRLAASTSFGKEKLIYYLGGVDNWWKTSDNFANTRIDFSQNYRYQTIATNMRGHLQNIRNGNSFAVINTEIRFPIFSYLIRKPIPSDFIRNFQIVGFGDVGTAWVGNSPFDDRSPSNTEIIEANPFKVEVFNINDPIVGGFGFGLRSTVLGYFVRVDWAWGVENGIVNDDRVFYLSLSLDI